MDGLATVASIGEGAKTQTVLGEDQPDKSRF